MKLLSLGTLIIGIVVFVMSIDSVIEFGFKATTKTNKFFAKFTNGLLAFYRAFNAHENA